MLDRGGGGYTQSKDRGNVEAKKALLARIASLKGQEQPQKSEDDDDA